MTFDEAMAILERYCCGDESIPDELDNDADLDKPGVREACDVIAKWTASQVVRYGAE